MRSDFSSSSLVRLLGAWGLAPPPATGMDFAERWGLWLNAFDAIKLQSAHQSLRARASEPAGAALRPAQVRDLQAQMQRVRSALAHAIAQDPVALVGADPDNPGFAPFQRRHGELQRHMEQMLQPLREQARLVLAQGSANLKQLAALDALMQDVLALREQQVLAGMPALLAPRFEALRRDGQAAAFAEDWRQALLAELDLRLEPVAGLVAALNNELSL